MPAPHIQPDDKVILFDGVCKLCSRWAKFLIRVDRTHQFKLASVQSPEGQAILKWYNMPLDHFETMVYVEGETLYTQSSAFLNVMHALPFPWPVFSVFKLIPCSIRDWLYDRIALNRYTLFGRYDSCLLPNADHASRFLGDG